MTNVSVRKFVKADKKAIQDIAYLTGYMGDSAEHFRRHKQSFAEIWTSYYTDHEPNFLYAATKDNSVVGLPWVFFLGFIANRLMRREARREWLANASLFVSIIAIGLMAGSGFMYGFMMSEVLDEPSTTYAVLSALMQPAVPYYIVINTSLVLFIMLFVVFFNWNVDRKRRIFSLIGVGLYLGMRWTYLVFAETRPDISTHTLSTADVEWFKRTLATDFRGILELIT